jgi:uncharacterized protein (TIGR02246 family)
MKQILIILLLLASSSFAFGQTQNHNSAQKHPVEAFFMSGIEAFNAHNLDKFMRQFTVDVEMYTPTGWLRGNQAVRERFVQTFKQFPLVKMEIEELKVREVGDKTVIVDFKWKTYPMGKGAAFHGVGSGVYVKRKGDWVEVLEHETVTKVDEALKMGSK